MMSKMYPYSLRPMLIFTTIIGFIWATAMAANSFRCMTSAAETKKLKPLDVATGILFLGVAIIEAFGAIVAFMQSIRLARLFYTLAPLGVILTLATQIMAVVLHFVAKGNLIHRCIYNTQGDATTDDNGDPTTISIEQASEICFAAWSRGTSTVIIWLIVALIISLLFASVALSYYRQLLDPSSVRQRNVPPQQTQAFQMQPGYYGPPPENRQSWMVPPYPGSANTPPPNFEKSDYQPEAEWANVEPIAYAPPSGPPPRNPFTDVSGSNMAPNRAEDEAWERARSEGVTAHLTGHAPPPATVSQGYVIGNPEEDEAWERARTEGVTAHLTGTGRGGEGRV